MDVNKKNLGSYWAKFKIGNGNLYRFDTRIYINPVDEILENDECIGAIVGKNPGSASPENSILDKYCQIDLKNDKLLPTVRNIFLKSMPKSEGRKYIQVLNLFYLCDAYLTRAIKTDETSPKPQICNSENKSFPWVWFMWGGYHKSLTSKKQRFKTIKTDKMFYLNHITKKIEESFPDDKVCAKHTQGMPFNLVLPFLGKLFN